MRYLSTRSQIKTKLLLQKIGYTSTWLCYTLFAAPLIVQLTAVERTRLSKLYT